jgi:hypothetical protein
MKPRRWYNSPELNPLQTPLPVRPFPTVIYWIFTTLTHREQGAIIKSPPSAQPKHVPGRSGAGQVIVERPRRINAA